MDLLRPILLCTKANHAEGNSEIVCLVRSHVILPVLECPVSDSTASATNSRGYHYNICTGGGEGGAKRCDRVHDTNSLSRTAVVFAIRRFVASVLRRANPANARQTNAARPWVGCNYQCGRIHSHGQPRCFGRGRNNDRARQ